MSSPESVAAVLPRAAAFETTPGAAHPYQARSIPPRAPQTPESRQAAAQALWLRAAKLEAQAQGIYKVMPKRRPDCDLARIVGELADIIRLLLQPPTARQKGAPNVLVE